MLKAFKVTDKTFHLIESLATASNVVPNLEMIWDYYVVLIWDTENRFRWCSISPEIFPEHFEFVDTEDSNGFAEITPISDFGKTLFD